MTESLDSGRVAVIGLDGAVPDLAFDHYADRMPTLSRLRAEGAWGRLRSIDPPITVPAWSCAMTGLSPGALGIYGFRNRRDHTYDRLVYYEVMPTLAAAFAREKQLKGWKRSRKVALIQSVNPWWHDLYESWTDAACRWPASSRGFSSGRRSSTT